MWRDGKYTRSSRIPEGSKIAALVAKILCPEEDDDDHPHHVEEDDDDDDDKGVEDKNNNNQKNDYDDDDHETTREVSGISAEAGTRGSFYYPRGAYRSWHTNLYVPSPPIILIKSIHIYHYFDYHVKSGCSWVAVVSLSHQTSNRGQ